MRFFFVVIFFCCLTKANTQPASGVLPLRFQHIDERQGLSNNVVNTIFKDSRGFMWIGTSEGLNMYDGSSFSIYRHSNIDTSSIPGNDIFSIAEDVHHHLWISSHCVGLSVLNPFNRKASAFISNETINDVCDVHVLTDEANNVWSCDRRKLTLFQANHSPDIFEIFSQDDNNQVYNFRIDKNNIWIGHKDGLKQFDISSKKFTTHDDWVNSSLCTNFYVDEQEHLFVCTWQKGLFIIDPATGERKELLNGKITNDAKEISFNNHRQLWVATDEGLYVAELPKDLFQLSDKDFVRYAHDNGNAFSLSNNEIKCVWNDGEGAVWLGTSGGINIFDPSYLQFSSFNLLYQQKPFFTTQLNYVLAEKNNKGNTIYDLCYWHGTGFLQTDSAFNIINHLSITDEKGNPIIISSCVRGKDGHLWLATWEGLICYDDKSKKIIALYKKEMPGKLHLNTNKIDFVLQDHKGRFWIGTYGFGLNMLDFANDTSYVFTVDDKKSSLANNRCDFIFEDSKGNIWLTGPALQKYNESTKSFITYASQKGNASSLPGSVNAITEDHLHHLWLATNGGLSFFDEASGSFQTYTTKDGLASDACNNLVEDSQGNIWVSTSGGLSSINISSRIITTYTTADGLPTNQLGQVILNDANRNILFSLDGPNSPITEINTVNLRNKKEIPFHFTSLSVLGTERPLDNSLEDLNSLRLDYKQNVFTVSFKALDYANPNNIRYRCILQGFDNNWIDLGHRSNVTYTNLDGGTYTLLVKATDAKGEWLSKQLQLKIIITPPFWKTTWFYVLCIILLTAGVYVFFKIRLNKIRREGEQKAASAKEIAELEMKALKAQMNPHFIFNALSSIQESIVHGQTEAASKYLGKFSKLIRMVLEFSDKKLITLQQEITYLTLYLELESFRFDNFHFTISSNESIDKEFLRIPPMLVQPFVENAIKHGLSHKNGEKNLSVNFEEQGDNFLKVTIDDNGIGREQAAELNLARNLSRQSMGIKITSRRLQLMNKEDAELMNVKDKTEVTGESAGTEVAILIPIETT